jgi:TIR domain
VSYSTEDRPFVDDLVNELKIRSVDVWYDKFEIKVGDSIVQKVNDGIGQSDWLIVVLSNSSVNSKWVTHELQAALTITIQKGAFLLPLRKDSVPIPTLLADRRYADFVKDPEQGFRDILEVVAPNLRFFDDQKSQLAWILLSSQFEKSVGNTSREEMIERWTGLGQKWELPPLLLEYWVDCCIAEGRLLYLSELIERLPTLADRGGEESAAVTAFLFKKAFGDEMNVEDNKPAMNTNISSDTSSKSNHLSNSDLDKTPMTNDELIEKLQLLKTLYEKGLLTPSEYKSKRQVIINRL